MLQVDVINVGDGDAIFVQELSGDRPFSMLIDCGRQLIEFLEGSKRQYAVDYLNKRGIRRVDLLVLTHMHVDHFGGGLLLLPYIRFQKAFVNFLPDVTPPWSRAIPPPGSAKTVVGLHADFNLYRDVIAGLQQQGCQVSQVGQNLSLRPTSNLSVEIYAPPAQLMEQYIQTLRQLAAGETLPHSTLEKVSKDRNNASLMVGLDYGGRKILLPGDNYASLLETMPLPKADVLKLPHHGDEKSLTLPMLEMIAPSRAVISCQSNTNGKNRPAEEVLDLLLPRCRLLCTENRALPALPPATHDTVRVTVSENGDIDMYPT